MENKIKNHDIMWFIGFCDAEGHFQCIKERINKDNTISIQYTFNLRLHSDDKLTIEFCKELLGNRGYIYSNLEKKKEISLIIASWKDLNWLINNIFIYDLLTKNQWHRYSRWKFGIIKNLKKFANLNEFTAFNQNEKLWLKENKLEIENLDLYDSWIIGFINGEGCFHINKKKNCLVFYIEQAEEEVLIYIRNRLNFSPKVSLRKRRKINRKDTYSLYISSKKDISNLVNFINRTDIVKLKGKKYEQYRDWYKFYLERYKT